MSRQSIGPSPADFPGEELTPLERPTGRVNTGAGTRPEKTSAPEELSPEEKCRRRARAAGPTPAEIANAAAAAEKLDSGLDW